MSQSSIVFRDRVQILGGGLRLNWRKISIIMDSDVTMSEDDLDWNPFSIQNIRKRKYPKSINVEITNVWATFDACCQFDLVHIVKNGHNVEFEGGGGLKMILRNPNHTATIHRSGKIKCAGATSEENARITARQFGRQLQKLGYPVQFRNFKIHNVVAKVIFPFDIDLAKLAQGNKGLW